TTENAEKVKFMRVKGEKIKITYTNCVTKGFLRELGCEIEGGKVETVNLVSETLENSMEIKFAPEAGATFATLTLIGASCTPKGAQKVTESTKVLAEGATLRTSANTAGALKFAGNAATLTSASTIRMKKNPSQEPAISITTTEP